MTKPADLTCRQAVDNDMDAVDYCYLRSCLKIPSGLRAAAKAPVFLVKPTRIDKYGRIFPPCPPLFRSRSGTHR